MDCPTCAGAPYTFIVLALLILILAPVVILRTPTDIFPNIDIPVIAAAFNYTGLSAEEMEERITSIYERSLTTTVNDIEHIESQSIDGRAIVKVFFQPGAEYRRRRRAGERDFAAHRCGSCRPAPRRRSSSPTTLRACPSCNWGFPDKGSPSRQLFDYGVNFIRTRLVTIPGCADSLSLRRQAAPDHGGYRPGRAAIQGPFARRCHQRHRQPEPDHSRREPRRSGSSNTTWI